MHHMNSPASKSSGPPGRRETLQAARAVIPSNEFVLRDGVDHGDDQRPKQMLKVKITETALERVGSLVARGM